MCFYNDDYDWCAELEEWSHSPVAAPCKCYECRREIRAGEWALEVYQQEHESCQICEDSQGDMYEYPEEVDEEEGIYGPGEHPCYYGETFHAFVCRECLLIREAIYDLEEKEGCPEDSRQPAIGELHDVMREDQAKWGDRKYTAHALELFPELASHKLCVA